MPVEFRWISVDLGGLKLANLDDYLQKFGLQLENQQQIIKKIFVYFRERENLHFLVF